MLFVLQRWRVEGSRDKVGEEDGSEELPGKPGHPGPEGWGGFQGKLAGRLTQSPGRGSGQGVGFTPP